MSGEVTIFITLGSDTEFGISDQGLFIRSRGLVYRDSDLTIDLGPSTRENFKRLIANMLRLECHLEE